MSVTQEFPRKHVARLRILEKAKFEPGVALGVAEAMESAMMQARFVTVPILDARLHGVSAGDTRVEGKLDANAQEHFLIVLENVALSLAATTVLNALRLCKQRRRVKAVLGHKVRTSQAASAAQLPQQHHHPEPAYTRSEHR